MGKIQQEGGSDYAHLDRKAKKPLMEKKRRKRINDSLNDLKNILLEIMKKDPSQTAKLEKADILEFTVQYLKELQFGHLAMASVGSPNPGHQFWVGWRECMDETNKYFQMVRSDQELRRNVLEHLESKRLRCFLPPGMNQHMAIRLPLVPALPAPVFRQRVPMPMQGGNCRTVKSYLNEMKMDSMKNDSESTKNEIEEKIDVTMDDHEKPWRPW